MVSASGRRNSHSLTHSACVTTPSSPAIGSCFCPASRRKIVLKLYAVGSSFAVSSHQPNGVDTGAPGTARSTYGGTA